jgi:hypothetical protein
MAMCKICGERMVDRLFAPWGGFDGWRRQQAALAELRRDPRGPRS